jgi:hypothetical protein
MADNNEQQGINDFHAPGDVPNVQIVVRGGASDLPSPGIVFSGSQGLTTADAASGVPHGQIRETTAGQIRSNGGTVEVAPELTRSGKINYRHVNVTEGSGSFGELMPNPVPKGDRIQ